MSASRYFTLGILLLLVPPIATSGQEPANAGKAYARSVVGVQVAYQLWDEDRPWAKNTPRSRSASAVVIDDGLLLTTADIVTQVTLMRLSTFGQLRPVELRLVHADPAINLALLAVDDPASLEGLVPLPMAESTPTSGTLRSVRWRGQQLEAAASRVVRFLVERGWSGRVEHAFLHLRTDMKNGGWAEPVLSDGLLVGLTVSQRDQDSRAVPVEIIRSYLERVRSGSYTSLPALGVLYQSNRDPSVSRYLGQEGDPSGILVRQVPWGSSGCGVLKPMDILLEIDGHRLDPEGYYRHIRFGHLKFPHLLAESYLPGDSVPVRVLRNREGLELVMTLRTYPAALDQVRLIRYEPPPFVVSGGFVFRELDVPYLRTWGKEWSEDAPIALLTRYYLGSTAQTPEQRRIVLITSVLPSDYNIGYQNLEDEVVERINGRTIGRIEDVVAALEDPQGEFHVIELSPDSTRSQVVLDAATLEAATNEIIETYRLPLASRPRETPLPEGGGSCAGDY